MINDTIRKKPAIASYFKELGIKDYKSEQFFWKHAKEVDPLLAEKLEPLMSRKKKGNLYEVKNETLLFSLAIESWTMSFHQSFLTWMEKQKQLKPKRILEIGCDNGLLACWYAAHFPDAEIVGIDQTENGIKCANELSKQLGIANVCFHQLKFTELPQHFPKNSFDLIISVRTFHEIMGPILIPNYWSLPDYLDENPTFGEKRYLQIVAHLLFEDGIYLSCERLENPADVGKWANTLKEANLNVQWDASSIIDYHELGVAKRSPIIHAAKKETGIATLEGMKHLYTKDSPLVLDAERSFSGAKAEFAFHQVAQKVFHSGMYLNVPNHWYIFRFEIWETHEYLLVYSYGNMGHRHLDILPSGEYEDAERLLQEAKGQFSHLGPVITYASLDECPE